MRKPKTIEEDIQGVLDMSERIPGWAPPDKLTRMFNLVLETQPHRIVEIGVFGGRSLMALAVASLHLPHPCQVVGIDAWSNNEAVENMFPEVWQDEQGHLDYWEGQDLERICEGCRHLFEEEDLMEQVTLIRGDSVSTVPLFDHIDILHIDGNHTDWSSTRDVCNWVPRVRNGGFIHMDDTYWATLQATALPMLEKRCELVETLHGDYSRIYQKVR